MLDSHTQGKVVQLSEKLSREIRETKGEEIVTAFRNGALQEEIAKTLQKENSFSSHSIEMLRSAISKALASILDPQEREKLAKRNIKNAGHDRMMALTPEKRKELATQASLAAKKENPNAARENGKLGVEAKGLIPFSNDERGALFTMTSNLRFRKEINGKWYPDYTKIAHELNQRFHSGEEIRKHETLQKWASKQNKKEEKERNSQIPYGFGKAIEEEKSLTYDEFISRNPTVTFNNFFFCFREEYFLEGVGFQTFKTKHPELFQKLYEYSLKIRKRKEDKISLGFYKEYEPIFPELFKAYKILKDLGYSNKQLFQ